MRDQTLLYSNKGWIDLPYCKADIEATAIGETLVLDNGVSAEQRR